MKSKKSNDLDLFQPVVEIFHELCMMVFTLVVEVAKFGWRKATNKAPPLQKIERKALQSKRETKNEDSLGIDTKTRKDIKLSEIDFKKHSFIVGASGFGKTNLISLLQENSLKENKPIVFFDPKGDLEALNTFKRLCEKKNRPCYIFSEHYKDSISLNPVFEGTVNQVSDRIMRSFDWSEQYYKDASRRSLSEALKKIKKDGKEFNLKTIYDYLCQMENKENLGLIVKLQSIVESDFGKILSEDKGMTFSQIREERACLYIGLSTQGYGDTAVGIGKLFLNELLYHSYKSLSEHNEESTAKKNPISIYFDEFGALVSPEFIELQNKCRGAGMELTISVQTASDIDRVNPDLTKQVIENVGNMFVLKQRLDASASFFSEAIGTILSKKKTFVTENGEEQAKGTVREVNELLVHPDIIKNLRVGQCVLLRQAPSQISLINLRNREFEALQRLNKLYRQNNPVLDL